MSGQGRAIALLGGLLAVGIGAAIWLMTSEPAPESGADKPPETATSAASEAKPAVGGPRRPKPKGTASIVGEVRRSRGKVPVAGQEVQLVPERGDPWTVTTDARGAFKLSEIPHGGPYELRVAASGCGTIRMPGMALDRNEKRDVGTLWLDPSVNATVLVRAWSDEPVAGALVEAYAVPAAESFDWSKAMAQMSQTPVAVTKATTDAKGEATFKDLAVGRWNFVAAKQGFGRAGSTTSLRSDTPPSPVTIYLGAGYPLSGRVFDSAKNPVAGAQVHAGPAGSAWDLSSSALRSRTTTDEQGRYQFASLESGDAQLMVGTAGGLPGAVATLKIPNVTQFDIYLKGAATLTGTVSEKDGGKPVEAATVRAFSYAMFGGAAAPAESVTDAQGKYSLVVSAGAVSQVTAEKDGWASADDPSRQQQPLQLREGETQTRDLKLRPGSKVTGVVKGPDGPIAAAKVSVTTGSNDRGWSTKSASTDADGRYEVASLIPGRAIVRADAPGFYVKDFPENYWMVLQSSAPSPFKLEVPEGATATKDLEMVRGLPVEGRVDGPEGPLAGVRVALPSDSEGGVVTGADGAFRIEGAKPAQSVAPVLVKEGYAASVSNKPFSVSADAPTTGIVLTMTRVVVVRGVVSASDGQPLRDGKVTAASWTDRSESGAMPMNFGGGSQPSTAPIHADGAFEVPLTGPSGNRLRVTATAFGHPSATSETVNVVEGRTEYVVNVNLDGGKDLEGKVVEKQGGAPVAGAAIYVQPRANRGGSGATPVMYDSGFFGRGGSSSIWAVTDADGRFAISHLAVGTYGISARADGYVAGTANVDLAAAGTVTVEIEPELSIEGVVTMPDGSPVEGAAVTASRDVPASAAPTSTTTMTSTKLRGMGGMGGGDVGGSTTTGVGGWFRVSGLTGGAFRLTVTGGRQGDLNIRTKKSEAVLAGAKDVKIVVDAGGVIAGRVLDPQKRGAPNVWVYANPEQNNNKPVPGAESRQTRTKEDGTFAVVGLADVTTFAVTVQANQGWDMGGGATWKNATLKGVAVGTSNVEIVLEEGLSINGVVVDAEGKPVANTYLFCQSNAAGGGGRQSRTTMTDAAGAFTVGGLEAGDCSFMLQPGMAGPLVLQNGEKVAAGSRDVRLVAAKGLTITGTVVDESGAPVKGATLNATQKSGGRGGYGQSRDDGTFEITGLVSGATYNVTATAAGRARGRVDDVVAGASAVRVVAPKGLEASGRVVDEKGAPVKGGQIFVHLAADSSQAHSATIDDAGNFTLKGLSEGTYEAQAMPASAAVRGYHKCGTLKGGDSGVELRMEP